ncbi:nucleotide pyrophosphohydrolase [Arthrobacter sp. MYb227]|uniref:nucleotide pyrophosphohydrolase n=1 Tax=Arthrobacter sp. MYb227 TaxID=1848601 RepID=UPI000CFDBC7D|nr:nucleotide pyrophosphohydrolase [Arthrobacter sp. MYb227]PQZ92890.1 nucleotide pyrophosphohydrolase [Arthrobacter sp. MYb227]
MSTESVMPTLREFVIEREWGQFHSAANLAKSISIESGELLECFQWDDQANIDRVKEELADVLTYAYLLADKIGLDPAEIILEKLQKTRTKYPVEKARGRSTKYDQL